MGTMDGHTDSHLYRDTSDDKEYLIISEWSEMDAFEKFIHSKEFAETANWGSAEILEGRPRHKVYR